MGGELILELLDFLGIILKEELLEEGGLDMAEGLLVMEWFFFSEIKVIKSELRKGIR